MNLVVGYDKDFAAQYFRRSIRELLSIHEVGAVILPREIDYLATHFGQTVEAPTSEILVRPQFSVIELRLLLFSCEHDRDDARASRLAEWEAVRRMLDHALISANFSKEAEHQVRRRNHRALTTLLFEAAAKAKFRTSSESFILRKIAHNVRPWMILMLLIAGKDMKEIQAEESDLGY